MIFGVFQVVSRQRRSCDPLPDHMMLLQRNFGFRVYRTADAHFVRHVLAVKMFDLGKFVFDTCR